MHHLHMKLKSKYLRKLSAFLLVFPAGGSKHCHDNLCVFVHGGVMGIVFKKEERKLIISQFVWLDKKTL